VISALFMYLLLYCNRLDQNQRNSDSQVSQYNVEWDAQSKDATGSMPLGGGNLGLNVWVENDDILFYIGHSDSRLENQKLIKLGRLRIKLNPTPFKKKFSQQLNLLQSCILIKGETENGKPVTVKLWVDSYKPVVHAELDSDEPLAVEIAYESWFFRAFQINSGLEWYYRLDSTKSDLPGKIRYQKLEAISDRIDDPLKNLTIGGRIVADGLIYNGPDSGVYMKTPFRCWKTSTVEPVKRLDIRILLRVEQEKSLAEWKDNLNALESETKNSGATDYSKTAEWWTRFWNRSHIIINPGSGINDTAWQIGRNYQLFRYMLGCNSTGKTPTLFNGGMFTFDNPLSDYSAFGAASPNPDERAWWDCLFMAQNQRLVYWPMIKSGDNDLLKIGLDFYRARAGLAQARSKYFFNVEGTPFPESIDIYGIMAACPSDYGHQGCEHLTYHYTSSLEFAFMMLENYRFSGKDFNESLPSIMGVLKFYDNFYQRECEKITGKPFDSNGKLIIYPGNSCEYGVGTRNHADAVSGLMALTTGLLNLRGSELSAKDKEWLISFSSRIPDIPVKTKNGKKYIAVADTMKKIANPNEFTQLYTLFPFHIYGIGLPDLDIAVNTWLYGTDNDAIQKEFMCWKYSNIGTACMGLTKEAKNYAINKFLYPVKTPLISVGYSDCARFKARFPSFWVTYPFDAFPDMDHGGSAMIGLQEMLMQTPGNQIILLPSWPEEWDVDFKLYAPQQTVVEARVRSGKLTALKVTPEERKKDVVISRAFAASE
jgi:hypothetical protein